MSVDLRPWLDAVPDAAANAIASARHALVVCHENPDADTLGAAIGVAVIVERHGGRATLISTDPVPPLYDFLGGMDRFRTDPEPGRRLRPPGRVRLRHARPRRRGPGPAPGAVRPAPARDHRPPRLDDEHRRRWTGSTRPLPRRASWSRCSRRGSTSRSMRRVAPSLPGLMAGIVMDTSTFAHPNSTPADPRRLGGAGRRRRAALGDLAAPVSLEARCAAPAVRARPRPPRDVRRRARHPQLPVRRRPDGHGHARLALRGPHRPPGAIGDGRGRDPVQGGRAVGHAAVGPDEAGRRRCDRPDRRVRWGWTRARGGRDGRGRR